MKKNKKRGGKKGASKAPWIISAFILIMIFLIYFDIHNNCYYSIDENNNTEFLMDINNLAWFNPAKLGYWGEFPKNEDMLSTKSGAGFLNFFLQCKKERSGIIDASKGFLAGILGFDKGVYDFGIDLLTGLLVGFWIVGIFWLANLEKLFRFVPFIGKVSYTYYSNGLKNSWLGFLGDNWWKIVPIGVFYAVIMQIPVITSIISVITFEPLLSFKSSVWGWFLKSLVIAFYIGFLPTMIEQYSKFLMRKRLYEDLENVRARVAQGNISVRGK